MDNIAEPGDRMTFLVPTMAYFSSGDGVDGGERDGAEVEFGI